MPSESSEITSARERHTCAPGDTCALKSTPVFSPKVEEENQASVCGPGQPRDECAELSQRTLSLDMTTPTHLSL